MGKKRELVITTKQMRGLRKLWILKNPPVGKHYECWLCKQPVPADSFTLDHVMTVEEWPEYAFELSNLRPAHLFCNQERAFSSLKVLRGRKILKKQ